MVDHAAAKPGMKRAELRQADAPALPFADESFDAVVCQFGVMFFPDTVAGYREARRVLNPAGGRFVFSVWDSLARQSRCTRCVADADGRGIFRQTRRASSPARRMAIHDQATIRRELAQAGFARRWRSRPSRCRAAPPRTDDPAIGFCQGTPMRAEIEALRPAGLAAATEAAAAALARGIRRRPDRGADAGAGRHRREE